MKPALILGAIALFSATTYANVIVDTKNVDQTQYHADLYECQQLSQQSEMKQTDSLGHDVVGSTAKGAALGAAGSAIAGGSGSKGAKVGAGIGVIGGVLKHGSEKREHAAEHDYEVQAVMRNCMIGRGYRVLN
ncbi:glycine zipper family protein [Vibrio agarivorans]|uniref:glycine zipper family protein n=1 Tax=Vibrio agarivorans TaxID=153622 RepID=UPI00222F20F0|nr:glycine zipper family protein [Vibrio agarivorans]MDN3663451.1 glycine zipper family protein [Vibrio agarivorans]